MSDTNGVVDNRRPPLRADNETTTGTAVRAVLQVMAEARGPAQPDEQDARAREALAIVGSVGAMLRRAWAEETSPIPVDLGKPPRPARKAKEPDPPPAPAARSPYGVVQGMGRWRYAVTSTRTRVVWGRARAMRYATTGVDRALDVRTYPEETP